MQKITPHLWFDTQAREAAELYLSAFGGDSRVTSTTPIADIVTLRLLGYGFMAISAGPLFAFNPSISFMFHLDPSRQDALDRLWTRLAEGGTPLMPLGQYPFSERYGWIADRYGVTWQLILSPAAAERSLTIMPSLMFTFAETKELIAGFWLWQVKSMDEAVEWLKRAPFDGGTEVEIRRVFEADDFGEEFTPELRAQEERVSAQAAANAKKGG